ncbi:MAG: BatA domain-containing protein [Planctomycetota bacterium]|nr:BatA domain-containing protein [Planctomycetota bacterium]
MNFLNPALAAAALACIAIPILIHILMRRRRRPVPWGAMRFLLEAYRRQRRRTNLEQLLLLATRCLLVAALALAVGKPVLGALAGRAAGGARTVVFVIDDGLASLAADGTGETDLARSKRRALEIIDTLDASRGDRVGVVTAGGPADAPVMPPTPEFAAAREVIAALPGTHARSDLAGALALAAGDAGAAGQAATSGDRVEVVVLSAFRAGSVSLETSPPRLPATGVALRATEPATAVVDDVAVVGVEPLRRVLLGAGAAAPTSTPVRVLLRRSGPGAGAAQTTRVVVGVEGPGADGASDGRARVVHTWSPGQSEASVSASVELPRGAASQGRIVLRADVDRDAIAPDDTFRRVVPVRDRLEVALVAPGAGRVGAAVNEYGSGDWLALALAPETDLGVRRRQAGEIRLSVFDPARPALPANTGLALHEVDAVLLPRPDLLDDAGWAEVARAWSNGAPVIVSAPEGVQTHLWGDALIARFGLDWTLPRESREMPDALGVVHTRADQGGILSLLNAEMPELLRGVAVRRVLGPQGPAGSFETLLALSDGTALLVSTSPPGGRAPIVYLGTAVHLEWTDLPTRPLMVPLVQELVRQSVGRAGGSVQSVAGLAPGLPQGAAELVRVGADAPGPALARVGPSGAIDPALRYAGLYSVRGGGGATVGMLAVNPDPAGAGVDVSGREGVERWLTQTGVAFEWLRDDAPGEAGEPRNGRTPDDTPPISPYLLGAAIALALVETVFARFFSHARVDDAPGGAA